MAGQKTDERDVHLGSRIARERKRAKLTQQQVAAHFDMSAAQLQKYEKGTNRISAIHLAILGRLTGVPVADFFAGIARIDDVRRSGAAPRHAGFSEDAQATLADDERWAGLAVAVTRHVRANLTEDKRREIAAIAELVQRELSQ